MGSRVGDQHKANGAPPNPFDDPEQTEKKQHISEYTAQEIATLQSRLDKQLGPEYISSRPGAGGQKVHYLAADKVISLANEIFGFNGWSSSIQQIQIDFVDEKPSNAVDLGLSVIVRVTLRDGTYHEDVGYGSVVNGKGKAAAFEKAKKEGTTDGLKRALRNFGNVLGNCIYDKDFIQKVTKVKVGAGKWDVDNLHRHQAFQPKRDPAVKPETKIAPPTVNGHDSSTTDIEAESFDIADFDDAEFDMNDFEHPDEVVLPADPRDSPRRLMNGPAYSSNSNAPRSNMTTPSRPPNAGPPPGMRPQNAVNANQSTGPQRMLSANAAGNTFAQQAAMNAARAQEPKQPSQEDENSSSLGVPSQHFSAINGQPPIRSAGFYSARAAGKIDADNNAVGGPAVVPRFNPHAESPSIRKTSGVDHNKSARLTRNLTVDTDAPQRDENGAPQAEAMQRTGSGPSMLQLPQAGPKPINVNMNMGAGMRTSAYRPPTRRAADVNSATTLPTTGVNTGVPAGVDRVLIAAQRQPLHDVSNMQQQHNVTAMTHDGADAKRQRLGGPVQGFNSAGAGIGESQPAAGGVG